MKKRLIIIALAVVLAGAAAWIWGGRFMVSLLRAYEHSIAGLSVKSVEITGHRMVYLEGGRGPRLLLVHGFGADKDHWTRLARHLTASYHVVAPDLPGFGESTRDPKASYDVAAQALRLREFAAKIGFKRFHLAGNSMGGNISAIYAMEHPDDVITLVLIDSGGIATARQSHFRQNLANGVNLLVVSSPDDFDRLIAYGMVKPPLIPTPLKRYFARRAFEHRTFNEKVMNDLQGKPASIDARLGSLAMPVLVIWGDQDRIIDVSSVDILKRGIRNCTAVIMKDCGHVPMLERPEETAAHMKRFIDARQ